MNRLKDRYQKEVAPTLKKEFGYANVMAIPRVAKIVVNMGLGEATANAKVADVGADEGTPVTEAYKVPFKFTGKIAKVTIELKEVKTADNDEAGKAHKVAALKRALSD